MIWNLFNYKSYRVNEKNYKSNFHSQYLTAHNYQHCLKVLDQNWKGFFAARDEYKKHPEKFTGKPEQPGFKHIEKNKNEVTFTKCVIQGA